MADALRHIPSGTSCKKLLVRVLETCSISHISNSSCGGFCHKQYTQMRSTWTATFVMICVCHLLVYGTEDPLCFLILKENNHKTGLQNLQSRLRHCRGFFYSILLAVSDEQWKTDHFHIFVEYILNLETQRKEKKLHKTRTFWVSKAFWVSMQDFQRSFLEC